MQVNLDPDNRLGYVGNLHEVVEKICNFFKLGSLQSVSHLAEGYEDCNLKLETTSGLYVCKLFADNQLGDYSKTRRDKDVADRLVEIILAIQSNGANTPRLVKATAGYLFKQDGLVALCYQWIDGSTYYNLDRLPNTSELQQVVRQAALINTTPLQPVYYHDIWAIPHIQALFTKVRPHLSDEDISLLSQVLERFDRLNIDDLPKCLVHGDMTKGNVLLSNDQTPFIIDFSITNWTVRIIELAVIVCNLLYDESDGRSLADKSRLVTDMYQKYNQLTPAEIDALPDLSLAGSAMEFLGSAWRQNFLNDGSEETNYWLRLGRQTLLRELGDVN